MFCPRCGANNPEGAQTCGACGTLMTSGAQPAQMPPMSAQKTSALAIWSLVLSFTCVGVIPAIILGILGIRQVNHRPREYTGKGLATAGIVVSSLVLLFLGVMTAFGVIMFPTFMRAADAAKATMCQSNVEALSARMQMYLDDYQHTYPPAAKWCDATKRHDIGELEYRCPSVPAELCGYAFNKNLDGKPDSSVPDAAAMVMLFESDGGWNASGGVEALIAKPRHVHGYTTGYADGHVTLLAPDLQGVQRWSP